MTKEATNRISELIFGKLFDITGWEGSGASILEKAVNGEGFFEGRCCVLFAFHDADGHTYFDDRAFAHLKLVSFNGNKTVAELGCVPLGQLETVLENVEFKYERQITENPNYIECYKDLVAGNAVNNVTLSFNYNPFSETQIKENFKLHLIRDIGGCYATRIPFFSTPTVVDESNMPRFKEYDLEDFVGRVEGEIPDPLNLLSRYQITKNCKKWTDWKLPKPKIVIDYNGISLIAKPKNLIIRGEDGEDGLYGTLDVYPSIESCETLHIFDMEHKLIYELEEDNTINRYAPKTKEYYKTHTLTDFTEAKVTNVTKDADGDYTVFVKIL